MAYTTITFEHPETNAVRVAPVGFSWTVLFFGFFPPLIRSDWKYGLIILAAALISIGWSNLIFSFIYNRLYIEELVDQGYLVIDSPYPDLDVLRRRLRLDLRTMAEAAAPQQQSPPRRDEPVAPPPQPEAPRKPHPTSNVPRIPLPGDEDGTVDTERPPD
jgi:hypothetical protein